MESTNQRHKLNGILEAIAAGQSCEQILAGDCKLTYHDIFHAIAEAPTSYWVRSSARNKPAGSQPTPRSARIPAKRAD